MTKINQLARLFQAVSARDWERARRVAEQVIDSELAAGHHNAAATLRGALANTAPLADPTGAQGAALVFTQIPDILTRILEPRELKSIEFPKPTRSLIESLLKEFRHRNVLAQFDLEPRRRILFHGPPGCGKTLSAKAFATELDLPLLVVRFDALVGAYLGQTAIRIREIFRFAEQQPCIMLIDEIDAVGRRRGRLTDVGELDRVVISIMQQLDLVRPAGMLIAASNVPEALDPALLRRFDAIIEFKLPPRKALSAFARKSAAKRQVPLTAKVLGELSRARTYADVEQIIITNHRLQLLRKV